MDKKLEPIPKYIKASKSKRAKKDPTLKLRLKGSTKSSFLRWQQNQMENL